MPLNWDALKRAPTTARMSVKPPLLLEEVFESLAGVVGARRRRGGRVGALGVGSGSSVFLDGHAKFVERAVVAGVLGRDARFDRLGAFELRAGVEKAALLAAMEFELALGTFAVGIETGSEDGAAVRAARAGDGANHARSARAELIGAARTAGWRLLLVRPFPLL